MKQSILCEPYEREIRYQIERDATQTMRGEGYIGKESMGGRKSGWSVEGEGNGFHWSGHFS
jgi:hypothetical protein